MKRFVAPDGTISPLSADQESLFEAISSRNFGNYKKLVDDGVNPVFAYEHGRDHVPKAPLPIERIYKATTLHLAAFSGGEDVVIDLLERGMRDGPNSAGTWAIVACASSTRPMLGALKALIKHGTQVDCVSNLNNQTKITPLWAAVSANNLDAAELLLSHGASPSPSITGSDAVTPLTLSRSIEMFDLLLDAGADVAIGKQSVSLAHTNTSFKAKRLHERGYDLSAPIQGHSETPLEAAFVMNSCQTKYKAHIHTLLALGVDWKASFETSRSRAGVDRPGQRLYQAFKAEDPELALLVLDTHESTLKNIDKTLQQFANKNNPCEIVVRSWLAREMARTVFEELGSESKSAAGRQQI